MKAPRREPFPSETALSTAVMKRIREEWDGLARKVHGNAVQSGGEPDIDACIRTVGGMGRAVKVELKQPGKAPTPRQYARLRAWEKVGALAGWVTNLVELDLLLSHVSEAGWLNPQLAREPGQLEGDLPPYSG